MRENLNLLINFCCTRTDPYAGTKSMGYRPTRLLQWFLLLNLDNVSYQDNFLPSWRKSKNHLRRDTDGNKTIPPAVMLKHQRLTRQFLPGQHASKHNSKEHIPFLLVNDDGFCFATFKVHLDK